MNLPPDRSPRKRALRALNSYADAVTQTLLPASDEAFSFASDEEIDARLAAMDLSDKADRRGNGFGDPNPRADRIMQRVEHDRDFVRDEITRVAITGVYHIWERSVIDALRAKGHRGNLREYSKIKCALATTGLDLAGIKKLRLLANAIKHGEGPSLGKVVAKYPDMAEGDTLRSLESNRFRGGCPNSPYLLARLAAGTPGPLD